MPPARGRDSYPVQKRLGSAAETCRRLLNVQRTQYSPAVRVRDDGLRRVSKITWRVGLLSAGVAAVIGAEFAQFTPSLPHLSVGGSSGAGGSGGASSAGGGAGNPAGTSSSGISSSSGVSSASGGGLATSGGS